VVELGDPFIDLSEEGRGLLQRLEERMNPRYSSSGGIYTLRRLSVVPTRARYYRGVQEIETENTYR
jgi:hypothetical protein